MDIQDIIKKALQGVVEEFEAEHGKCACLACTLQREGVEMNKNPATTLAQIEENELDYSSAMLAREVAVNFAEYNPEMYERATASAARLGFHAFAKAYGILLEARRQLGEMREELHAERDAKQEAMDEESAPPSAPSEETPEEEPLPSR